MTWAISKSPILLMSGGSGAGCPGNQQLYAGGIYEFFADERSWWFAFWTGCRCCHCRPCNTAVALDGRAAIVAAVGVALGYLQMTMESTSATER